MKEYIVNENGVCINPDRENIYMDKHFDLNVAYACYNDTWSYGIDVHYKCPRIGIGGWDYGCSFNPGVNNTFSKKEDCKKAAMKKLLNYFNELDVKNDLRLILKPVIDTLKSNISVTQLTLF